MKIYLVKQYLFSLLGCSGGSGAAVRVPGAVVEVSGAVVAVSGAHWNKAGYALGASAPSTAAAKCLYSTCEALYIHSQVCPYSRVYLK